MWKERFHLTSSKILSQQTTARQLLNLVEFGASFLINDYFCLTFFVHLKNGKREQKERHFLFCRENDYFPICLDSHYHPLCLSFFVYCHEVSPLFTYALHSNSDDDDLDEDEIPNDDDNDNSNA